MKLTTLKAATIAVELDPTDALQLADACRFAARGDLAGDHSLLDALAAGLEAMAWAAYAIEHGQGDEAPYDRAGLREVWAPHDSSRVAPRRTTAGDVRQVN